MKKLLLVLIMLVSFNEVFSQFEDYFREKSNIVIFSGLVLKQGAEDKGNYLGTYLDYQVFKSDNGKWTMAPYAVFSRSQSGYYSGNDYSKTTSYAYGGGLSLGFYEENFTFRHQLFTGFSLGLRREEDSNVVETSTGKYFGVQKDLMLKTGLNINLLKGFGLKPDLFHRSQLQASLILPLRAVKKAVWENNSGLRENISDSYSWNKTYFELLAKQNIIKTPIDWQQNFYFSPKLVGLYSFSAGDSRHFYGLGVELACHRAYRDDFLTLGALYKVSRRMTDNYFILSLNFNLSSLLRSN